MEPIAARILTFVSKRISIFGPVADINASFESKVSVGTNTLIDTRPSAIISISVCWAVIWDHALQVRIVEEIVVWTKVDALLLVNVSSLGACICANIVISISVCIIWAICSHHTNHVVHISIQDS